MRVPFLAGQGHEMREQLRLAEVAAVAVVARVGGIGQLLRAHEAVAEAELLGDLPGHPALLLGQGLRIGGHGEGVSHERW